MGEMLAMGLDVVCNEIGDVGMLGGLSLNFNGNLTAIKIEAQKANKQLHEYDVKTSIERYFRVYQNLHQKRD